MNKAPRKRKSFTVQEKLHILDQVNSGVKQTQLSKDLGISESTLRGWKREEEKLRGLLCSLEGDGSLQRKKLRVANDEALDSALFWWCVQARSKMDSISGLVLKAQAEKLDRQINGENSSFKASQGWLCRFKKRHAINQLLESDEVRAEEEATSCYPSELNKILKEGGYSDDQVYNCAESDLYLRMLPDSVLEQQERLEQRKDRVALLLCVNKSGSHKLKPLMIGEAVSHVNMKVFPFEYTYSKNARIRGSVFKDWFYKSFVPTVRAHLRKLQQGEKALLLLTNCFSLTPAENIASCDGNIKVVFLYENITEMQPLDQGVISVFKKNYNRELMKRLTADNDPVEKSLDSLTLKEICYLGGKAWDAISTSCIQWCWMKALGEAPGSFCEDDDHDVKYGDRANWFYDKRATEEQTVQKIEVVEVAGKPEDDEVSIKLEETNISKDNIKNEDEPGTQGTEMSIKLEETNIGTSASEGNFNDEEDDSPTPTVWEVVEHLEKSLKWLEMQDVDGEKVLHLRSILDFARMKQGVALDKLTG